MRKLFGILIVLYILYFTIQFCTNFFSTSQKNTYVISTKYGDYQIKENYYRGMKNNTDHYNFVINDTFSFKVYEDFTRRGRIIEDLKVFKDDTYECIYPIFKGKDQVMDMICKSKDQTRFYHTMQGQNSALDTFVYDLPNYSVDAYKDQKDKAYTRGLATFYPNNLTEKLQLAINSYKGIYNIRLNNDKEVSLFTKDIYEPKIAAIAGEYYVTANYDEDYHFTSFLRVDLVDSKQQTIDYNGEISYASTVQGVADNKIYLYDPENQKQLEIDPEKRTVKQIASGNKVRIFNGIEWEEKEIMDGNYSFPKSSETYAYISPGKYSGQNYRFVSTSNGYDVYRSSILNPEIETYLFTTPAFRNPVEHKGTLYFLSGTEVKAYNDASGLRTLASMNEFTFNNSLNFYVYSK